VPKEEFPRHLREYEKKCKIGIALLEKCVTIQLKKEVV
jgi:hypothetical protein